MLMRSDGGDLAAFFPLEAVSVLSPSESAVQQQYSGCILEPNRCGLANLYLDFRT
jgi:hypothetical protein